MLGHDDLVAEAKIMERTAFYAVAALVVGLIIGAAIGIYIKPAQPTEGAQCPECAIPVTSACKFVTEPPEGTEVRIVVGFDANYPPFTYVLPNGSAAGFDIDVMKWIANKYGWELELKPWDWSTIVTALENGDLDVIASGMSIIPERASEKIWFSIPYYSYIHELVAKADDTRTAEEILNSGAVIAVQKGSTAEEWADKLLAEGYNFQKLALNSYVEALQALLDGRAQALITDSAFLEPYLKQHPDVATQVRVVTTLGAPETYGIATRPCDIWLRTKINDALHELMTSPEWNKLLEKWGLG